MIKLIITDMDGTLLNNSHKIDDEFWPLLDELEKKDVIFAVASGRPYYNLAVQFEDVKDKMLFIGENGAIAMYKGQELFSTELTQENVLHIKEVCSKLDKVIPIFCAKDFAYIEASKYEPSSDEVKSEIAKYYNCMKIIEDISKVDAKFIKIAVCDPFGSETNSYPVLKEDEKVLQIALSGKVWTDVSKLGTNKGKTIREVLKKLNITPQEAMAFGDYLNDLDMLREVEYSYAMKNSHPDLFEVANYVTKDDNDNFGVINTIKELLEI